MKLFTNLFALTTFVLFFLNKTINALNVNEFEFSKEKKYYIRASSLLVFSDKAYLKSCRYNQSKKNINCDFDDEKYKSLYVNIPLYHIDPFTENDVVDSVNVYHAYINDYKDEKGSSDEIAATSRYGIKENKKIYYNKNENYGNCLPIY